MKQWPFTPVYTPPKAGCCDTPNLGKDTNKPIACSSSLPGCNCRPESRQCSATQPRPSIHSQRASLSMRRIPSNLQVAEYLLKHQTRQTAFWRHLGGAPKPTSPSDAHRSSSMRLQRGAAITCIGHARRADVATHMNHGSLQPTTIGILPKSPFRGSALRFHSTTAPGTSIMKLLA